jgi:formamidopyrimidine-DNA glycosylase
MPEMPEVEAMRRVVAPRVEHSKIIDSYSRQPKAINLPLDDFQKACRQNVKKVERRAKSLVFQLSEGSVWLHLGLTADAEFLPQDGTIEESALGLAFDNGVKLAVRSTFMGRMDFFDPEETAARWNEFGPEPLDSSFSLAAWRSILAKGSKQSVKALLMDQSAIAGIGNVYSDEILYEARLYPLKKAGELDDAESERAFHAIKTILKLAVKCGGEMPWPKLGPGLGRYRLRVHGRKECDDTEFPVEKIKSGNRTAYYCPELQKR